MNLFNRTKKILALSLFIALMPTQAQAFWGLDSLWAAITSKCSSLMNNIECVGAYCEENPAAAMGMAFSAGVALYCGYTYWKNYTKSAQKKLPKKSGSSRKLHKDEMAKPSQAPTKPASNTPQAPAPELTSKAEQPPADVPPATPATKTRSVETEKPTAAPAQTAQPITEKQMAQLKYIKSKRKKTKSKGGASPAKAAGAPAILEKAMPAAATEIVQSKVDQEAIQKNSAEEEMLLKLTAQADKKINEFAVMPFLTDDDSEALRHIGGQLEDLLRRCTATLYDDLHSRYAQMFQTTPKMHKDDVYKRLHYKSNAEGIKQTRDAIFERYKHELLAKAAVIKLGAKPQDQELDIIGWILNNRYAKENFDHYLQGKEVTARLQISNAQIKAMLEALCLKVQDVLDKSQKQRNATVQTFNDLLQQQKELE